jgi:hypothetical protein
MIAQIVVYVLRCDGCGNDFEWSDEEVTAIFDTARDAEEHGRELAERAASERDDGWTSNGEGLHHCPTCPALPLTPAALDEIARRPGPNDVPLFEVAT